MQGSYLVITRIILTLQAQETRVDVVRFGPGPPPAPPYAVVKQENDTAGRGTAFRIIGHFMPGQETFLEDYMRDTVGEALDNFEGTDRHGNFNKLYYDTGLLPELITNNDDGTIAMERVYYMPDRLF